MTKSRVNADNVTADIAGITAGTGITGGGTSGTVTITNDMATTIAAKGDLLAGTANDAYAAITVGSNGQVLTANSATATGLEFATVAAIPAHAGARVDAAETTSSNTYTNLTTAGPAVTVTTGTSALIIVSFLSAEFSYNDQVMGFQISGATTRGPEDTTAASIAVNAAANISFSRASYISLTAGSNTFTAKYKSPGFGNRTFARREIFVMNLG